MSRGDSSIRDRVQRQDEDRRGGIEMIGVILLFGLVIVGVALIMLQGSSAVDSAQQQNNLEAAEQSMKKLKGELNSVVYNNKSPSTKFEMPNAKADEMSVTSDGTLSFTVNGKDACTAKRKLGTIKYETNSGVKLAYQANAVFKQSKSGQPQMISQPGLKYYKDRPARGAKNKVWTISYPVTNVNASTSAFNGSTTVVAKRNKGMTEQFKRNLCLLGKDSDKVPWVANVTVKISGNSYYKTWAEFLREQFREYLADHPDAIEVYDHNQSVVVQRAELGTINDDDDDGVPNSVDNCAQTTNYQQYDEDSDGIGVTCDNVDNDHKDKDRAGDGDCADSKKSTGNCDNDEDGVSDFVDNCPNVANPSQADADNDGTGNNCEDGDNIGWANDNCPETTNPLQADTDGDGIGNACDIDGLVGSGSNPYNPGVLVNASDQETGVMTTHRVTWDTGSSSNPEVGNSLNSVTVDYSAAGNGSDAFDVGNVDQTSIDIYIDEEQNGTEPLGHNSSDQLPPGEISNVYTANNSTILVVNLTGNYDIHSNDMIVVTYRNVINHDVGGRHSPITVDVNGDRTKDGDIWLADHNTTQDSDNDGVNDNPDNCPAIPNGDQQDTDDDGNGDACDDSPNGDPDRDGINNSQDPCQDIPSNQPGDTDYEDQDGDRTPDICDADADGDGYTGANKTYMTDSPSSTLDQCDQDAEFYEVGCYDDTDGDGRDNMADECPQTAGGGAMGCEAIEVKEGKNALLVNSTEGDVTVLGGEITRLTVNEGNGTRRGIDVALSLDRSGSMNFDDEISSDWQSVSERARNGSEDWPDDWKIIGNVNPNPNPGNGYCMGGGDGGAGGPPPNLNPNPDPNPNPPSGRPVGTVNVTQNCSGGPDGDDTNQNSNENENENTNDGNYSYVYTYTYQNEEYYYNYTYRYNYSIPGDGKVPQGEDWLLKCGPSWSPCTDIEYSGEDANDDLIETGDPIKRRSVNYSDQLTVPSDEVWLLRNDSSDDVGRYDSVFDKSAKFFAPGESFDTSRWDYYYRFTPGSDPYEKRVDAARTFIGELNQSKDKAAFVEFNQNHNVVQGLTNDLDDVNDSLRGLGWGNTNMKKGLDKAINQVEDTSHDENVVILMSDGQHDGPDSEVIDEAEHAKDNTTIYTIGLGPNADEDLLQEVANVTNGSYYHVSNAGNLEDVFGSIAEDVTKARRIDDRKVTGELRYTNGSVSMGDVNSVTDDDGTVSSQHVDSFDNGTLMSVSTRTYTCDSPSLTGETRTHDGKTYEEAICSGGSQMDTTTNSSGDHMIFTDGDSVSEVSEFVGGNTDWYEDGIQKIADDYINSSGQFNLTKDQAIFVTKLENSSTGATGYAVMLFDATNNSGYQVIDAPTRNDRDHDGIPDSDDNCAPSDAESDQNRFDMANNGQRDADNDGLGNVCDENDDDDSPGDNNDDCTLVGEDDDGVRDSDGCPDAIDNPALLGGNSPDAGNGYVVDVGGGSVTVEDDDSS